MSLLTWIILGLIAGFIAHKIVGETSGGPLMNTGLGIIGAVAGGEIMSAFGKDDVSGLNLYSLGVAIAGAILVLVVVNTVKKMQNGA